MNNILDHMSNDGDGNNQKFMVFDCLTTREICITYGSEKNKAYVYMPKYMKNGYPIHEEAQKNLACLHLNTRANMIPSLKFLCLKAVVSRIIYERERERKEGDKQEMYKNVNMILPSTLKEEIEISIPMRIKCSVFTSRLIQNQWYTIVRHSKRRFFDYTFEIRYKNPRQSQKIRSRKVASYLLSENNMHYDPFTNTCYVIATPKKFLTNPQVNNYIRLKNCKVKWTNLNEGPLNLRDNDIVSKIVVCIVRKNIRLFREIIKLGYVL
jgi:hypothetical protein